MRSKNNPIVWVLLVILTALSARSAWAVMHGYTPISKADLRRTFKLHKICDDKPFKDGKVINAAGCEMTLIDDGENLDIKGKDLKGKAFEVVTAFSGLGTVIYTGDLDKNGVEDIVITGVTGGCGLAPPQSFDTVLFDRNRRPTLWGVDSYGSDTTAGNFDDLITLPGDPRAVMIEENLEYQTVGKRDFSYWSTLLYRAENGGWRLIQKYQGHPMPLVVRFRFKDNHELVKNIPSALKTFADVSTVTPDGDQMKETVIKSIKYDDQKRVEGFDLGDGIRPPAKYEGRLYYGANIYKDSDDVFQVASMGTTLGNKLIIDAANSKTIVKVPRNVGPFPIALWITDKTR